MQEQSELDSTVPTDLTISSFSDDEMQKWKIKIDSNSNARKNFAKEIQLLKLELVRKNTLIKNLESELSEKTRNLDEKLKDALHRKQISENVLKTRFGFIEEDLKRKLNITADELQKEKEENITLKNDFKSLNFVFDANIVDEDKINNLKMQSQENLALTDFVMLKIYEREQALRKQNGSLSSEVNKLQALLPRLQDELQNCKQALQKEKADHLHVKEQYDKLLSEHSEINHHAYRSTYAQENFQRIKFERDHLHSEVLKVEKTCDDLKTEIAMVIQDKDYAKQEMSKLQQSRALLQQECEMVSQQLNDVMQKWGESQDKIVKLQIELDQAKSSREDLMERFMRSKDQQRLEFEERINFERHHLSTETKFKYEQELRSLNEAKNSLFREKQALETTHFELKRKYEELFADYEKKQGKEIDLVRKLQQDVADKENKIKKIEKALDQLQVKYQDKCKDCDKINEKFHILERQSEDSKKATHEKNLKLEKELGYCKVRLEILEKMETEMNELMNEAALMQDPDLDENLDNIIHQLPPVNAKSSFIRNINLTRKTMELERKLQELQNKLEAEKKTNQDLSKEVQHSNQLLDQVQQPYSYLLSTIKENEKIIQELMRKVKIKQEELESALKQGSELEHERNQLITDLGVVLQNRQEIVNINQQIESIKATDSLINQRSPISKKDKKKGSVTK